MTGASSVRFSSSAAPLSSSVTSGGIANPPRIVTRQIELTSQWLQEGRRFAIAMLVDANGSSPFAPGAFLLIDEDGSVEGSITGGCVETDLVVKGRDLLRYERPARLLTFGVSDDPNGTPGLMCGGTVRVLLHELRGQDRSTVAEAFAAVGRGEPVALGTLLDGPQMGAKLALAGQRLAGELRHGALLDHSVATDLGGLRSWRGSVVRRYGERGETLGDAVAVHLQSFLPPPTMLIVGAMDYSAALARLARSTGFEVVIVDPRETFAASERFSEAAKVVVGWPQEIIRSYELGPEDALVVLSHDPKFDEPALVGALQTRVGYIGALGSRRTTAARRDRLARAGISEAAMARVRAPCGLDLGAVTPEDVALSILAEIVAVRHGRSGGPLQGSSGPIRARESGPMR